MDYKYERHEIQEVINQALDRLETNYQTFNSRLEDNPEHHQDQRWYWQKDKIRSSITDLKKLRGDLDQIHWL
jgi:hypothetical protein